LSNEPTKLLLIENSEIALYSILSDLKKIIVSTKSGHIPELVPFLTSVQDKEQIQEIISTFVPDTIYHSAAFKHVSLVEQSVVSSIKNNVLGTLIMAEAAIDNGVQHFVLISSDKAVRPTSVMGATKRLAEMVLQALASKSHTTTLSIVRFGNVLDSSGSVVPKFRQQISKGGPITVTHPDVNRYFMTISEASQLVIQAGALARCGDLFMLDMGQPVKIIDLARRMVELSGLRIKDKHCPEGDIEIEFTGLQPGEKLFEELFIVENSNPTNHPQIKQGFDKFPSWLEIMPRMNELTIALKENDVRSCLLILQHLVEGYMPSIHFDELLSTKKTNIHTTDKKG
jgi:FlaA1/EpsC-like NDP-sugar epimerase